MTAHGLTSRQVTLFFVFLNQNGWSGSIGMSLVESRSNVGLLLVKNQLNESVNWLNQIKIECNQFSKLCLNFIEIWKE